MLSIIALIGQYPAWEWVEVFNNTVSPIGFGGRALKHDGKRKDDTNGNQSQANHRAGSCATEKSAEGYRWRPDDQE